MLNEVFEKAYSRLNAAQKEAVDTIYGPAMVIAGPGTGKTQIVACRTANILMQTDVRPDNILITTFTEAGVISIKKRLLDFLGPDAYKVEVSTIHSFCNEVIRMYPEKFLAFRAKRSIDDVEQIEILENILMNEKFEALTSNYDRLFYLPAIRDRIGKLKQEGVNPLEFDEIITQNEREYKEVLAEIDPKLKKYETTKKSQETHIAKLRALREIYAKYLDAMSEQGAYDFSDMISFVGRVLQSDVELRAMLAERYQFIMLDEFQDMSSAQNMVVDGILSASETPNIMTVGDDDQSIYRFQGANLENMFHFSQKYEGVRFIVLSENYRSIEEVLQVAKESIEKNTSRITKYVPSITKELHANYHPESRNLSCMMYSQPLEERAMILEKIRTLIEKDGIEPHEIAILVNTNREASEFAEFLSLNGVKAFSKKQGNALESYFVRLFLDVLQIILDPYSQDEKLLRIMRSGLFDLESVSILKLNRTLYKLNFKRQDRLRIFDALLDKEFMENAWVAGVEKFYEFAQKIIDLHPQTGLLQEDIKTIVESLDFIRFVEKEGRLSDLESVFGVLETIKEWNYANSSLSLSAFLKKLEYYEKYNLVLSSRTLGIPERAVVVLTAHQSKGLEYDTVFMPNLIEGNWGGRRVADHLKLPKGVIGNSGGASIEAEAEEEIRRLFFVGMTRAKRQLLLSYSVSNGTKETIASRFLTELSLRPEMFSGEVDYAKIIAASNAKQLHFKAKLDDEEIAYIQEFLSTYKLSPSDLSKFMDDPKLFLRDVIFKYPFEDNEYTIFGKNYHKALEDFYLAWKRDGKIPSKESLLTSFHRSVSREFVSADTLSILKKKGEEGLSGWYELHKDRSEAPLELEYSFSSRGIVFEDIPLTGTIDKIELVSEPNGVRLVDYKTGRAKTLGEIKGETKDADGKYFRQLLFYELMFSLDPILSSKYQVESLGIDFVEGKDGKYPFVEVERSPLDVEKLKADIRSVWKCINDPDYWRGVMGVE